jgi:hypothetical protein
MGYKRTRDDFIAELDIIHNQRRHEVPPLRFVEGNEGLDVEILRNDIWNAWLEKIPVRQIANAAEVTPETVNKHLNKCKKMYDKWVTENGLDLHGDPANRLEDAISDIQKEMDELEEQAQECKVEGDIRGYKELKKLKHEMRKEMTKFMGVEPEKKLNVEVTSAEETRRKMAELFPSDEVIDPEEEDEG